MMETNQTEDAGKADTIENDGLFVWDEESKLYFHASTGFYHDPDTGWYYSSRDDLYYTFENGTYVPLTCNKEEKSAALQCSSSVSGQPPEIESFTLQHFPSDGTKNEQQSSQWIEETLIDLYLSGYTKLAVSPDKLPAPQLNEQGCQFLCVGLTEHDDLPVCQNGSANQQNDECTMDFVQDMDVLADIVTSKEEENWQAQYGQVFWEAKEDFPSFSVVDLWDWEMIVETAKNNHHVSRLKGKFARRSSKLHPSVPDRGGLLKTAAIRDVHLDLVRVASGRVYRLRSPSMKYLISLSTYDSSNPTKDWDFPDIFAGSYAYTQASQDHGNNLVGEIYASSSTTLDEFCYIAEKKNNSTYRDRAAERRALHGAFGRGLGQKSFLDDNSAPQTTEEDEVVNEATSTPFGPGSYARKILEGMGWKHGESLGRSNKGILEPLHPVGNKGYAGLGWNHGSVN